MFKLWNIFSKQESVNDIPHACILHERYHTNPIDIYRSFSDPLFDLNQVKVAIGESTSTSRYINQEELFDFLFTSRSNKVAPDFFKWIRNVLSRFNNQQVHISYDEIEKTGHVYVLQTDGGIKVGKTKDSVMKRKKGLQTGNVNDIKILYDYHTCNEDLLERYVHYILQRYRCNSNREFFDCNVDYIINVIHIAGNVLDTLRSSFETITSQELMTKLDEKLGELDLSLEYTTCNESEQGNQGNENDESSIGSSPSSITSEQHYENTSDFYRFMLNNIKYKRNGFLTLDKICRTYYNKRVSPRSINKNVESIQEFIKENFENVNHIIQNVGTERGWKHLTI